MNIGRRARIAVGPDLLSELAPIFAMKSAGKASKPNARRLKASQLTAARTALSSAVPSVLPYCSGFSMHPDSKAYPNEVVLWDFMNGREIRLRANERGGYDLVINTAETCWTETQIPLGWLLVKLLALDYTPEGFRAMTG